MVDLDALAKDLREAGWSTQKMQHNLLFADRRNGGMPFTEFSITDDGQANVRYIVKATTRTSTCGAVTLDTHFDNAYQIIRRHIEGA